MLAENCFGLPVSTVGRGKPWLFTDRRFSGSPAIFCMVFGSPSLWFYGFTLLASSWFSSGISVYAWFSFIDDWFLLWVEEARSVIASLVSPPELTWLIIGSCLYISSFLQLRVTWFQSIPLSITGRPPNFARASSLPSLHSHRHYLPPFHPSLSSLDYQPWPSLHPLPFQLTFARLS